MRIRVSRARDSISQWIFSAGHSEQPFPYKPSPSVGRRFGREPTEFGLVEIQEPDSVDERDLLLNAEIEDLPENPLAGWKAVCVPLCPHPDQRGDPAAHLGRDV